MARKEFRKYGVLHWRASGARYSTKGGSVDLGVIPRAEAEKYAWLWGARLVTDDRDVKEFRR